MNEALHSLLERLADANPQSARIRFCHISSSTSEGNVVTFSQGAAMIQYSIRKDRVTGEVHVEYL